MDCFWRYLGHKRQRSGDLKSGTSVCLWFWQVSSSWFEFCIQILWLANPSRALLKPQVFLFLISAFCQGILPTHQFLRFHAFLFVVHSQHSDLIRLISRAHRPSQTQFQLETASSISWRIAIHISWLSVIDQMSIKHEKMPSWGWAQAHG